MKIVIGKRRVGKTTRLIKRSANEGLYILVSTRQRAYALSKQAKDMGLDIPFPITVSEVLVENKLRGSIIRSKGLLIDDADDVLQQFLAGIQIHEVTMTDYSNIEYLTEERSKRCEKY